MSTRLEDPRLKRLRRQAKKRDLCIWRYTQRDSTWVVRKQSPELEPVFVGTLDEIERFLQEAS